MTLRILPNFLICKITFGNFKLHIGNKFRNRFNISFEKRYSYGKKEIIEYYINGYLWCTSEKRTFGNYKTIYSFGPEGDLFSKEKLFFSSIGELSRSYNWILNSDGTITEYMDCY